MDTILYFSPLNTTDARETLAGIEMVTRRRGIHVQSMHASPTSENVSEVWRLWDPVGAIIYIADADPSLFSAYDVPIAMICHDPATLPGYALAVNHDSAETGRTAARELLAMGCVHFAYVGNALPIYWSDIRGRAFAAAVRAHGYDCRSMPDAGIAGAATAPTAAETKFIAAWQKRFRAFLRSLPKPCGLFAANDYAAAEVLAAARHEDIKVPDELAVLGVDNDKTICERATPTLSSIEPNFRHAGFLAASLLLEAAAKPSGARSGRSVVFSDLGVARRASTSAASARDPFVAEALERIRKEACMGLRPADVAALFNGTRRVADLKFKRAVGRTIGEEIHAVQLETAKRMLADPARRIDAISDFCGFTAPGAMRKFFRRETGMSMSEWRRRR